MATNMTIKRYDGSNWTEYAPATTIGQVSGLQTALNAKEVSSNKVTSISNSSTDTQYPSAKCVYDQIVNVINVAEGKSTSYSSYAYSDGQKYYLAVGNTQQADGTAIPSTGITLLEITGSTINLTSYQYLYKISSLDTVIGNIKISDTKNGDILLIVQTELPDFWVNTDGDSWGLEILETTKVPIEDYVPITRTVNGKALSSDITLTASDVGALADTTAYLASATTNGNTLTITPSSGSAITYTPTIPTNYLSDTPTSRSDSDSNTTYVIGKGSTSATGTNYYNSKVYFKGDDLYATSFNASNSLQLSSLNTADANGLSNQNGDLYWKSTKVVTGNYIKSASVANNVLTLTNQSDGTTTLTNTTTYIGSSTPSNAHSGDIWFVTA